MRALTIALLGSLALVVALATAYSSVPACSVAGYADAHAECR